MNSSQPIESHGSNLVSLVVDEERGKLLKEIAQNLPDVALNDRQLCDFELLATGAFSPLKGFMLRSDYESVIDRMRLQNGMLWPIPICLDIPETVARSIEAGQSLAIRDPEGFLLGIMHVEDLWAADKSKEARALYGSVERDNISVRYVFDSMGEFYVGGRLEVVNLPIHFEFKQLRMTPHEIRSMYKKLAWQRVVGFPTRSLIHRPQFEMTIRAMRRAKANLLILPITGPVRPGDLDFYTRVRCLREGVNNYPPDSNLLNLLPLSIRLAGVRDLLLNAIITKNYGCTHCLADNNGFDTGEDLSSPQIDAYCQEIGVTFIPYAKLVYLPFDDTYEATDQVPEKTRTITMSEPDIIKRVRLGSRVPDWATFPGVVTELRRSFPAPADQGFTIFLTGYSGAGKSTVARILYSRFLEMGGRPVTLLDGDIVRHNLSSELNFSKEHRDINVRRIGFVAGEITKNRGIAICAPIAPYAGTRNEIRWSIEAYGGFIEIHMSTPLEVCEQRDRKGMYAKARAGLIKGFTGVDDPYEVPESPELRIDTTNLIPDEAAQEILLYLGQKGYI